MLLLSITCTYAVVAAPFLSDRVEFEETQVILELSLKINSLRKEATGERNSLNYVTDIFLKVIKATKMQMKSHCREKLTSQGPRDRKERTARSPLSSFHNGSMSGMGTQLLPLHTAHSASWDGIQQMEP